MSRDWAAVYAAMLTKPKYRRLSFEARGLLLHLWLLAGTVSPEATWNADELRETLTLDGAPAGALDALISGGWVDLEDDCLTIHDWDEWQYAASRAIKAAWEADRARRGRAEGRWRKVPPTPPSKEEDQTRQDMTGVRTRAYDVRTEGTNGDAWKGWDPKWEPFREALEARGLHLPPTIRQRDMLWPIIDARPNDAAAWVRAAPPGQADAVFAFVLRKWKDLAA